MEVVGGLADAVEEGDALVPFRFGELHVADEGVHVADEAGHDGAQAFVRGLGHGFQYGVGDLRLVVDDHGRFSLAAAKSHEAALVHLALPGGWCEGLATTLVTSGQCRKSSFGRQRPRCRAVIDSARRGEPSIITRHGRREAVVVSFEEWERLSQVTSFGRLLLIAPLEPDDIPPRGPDGLREMEV